MQIKKNENVNVWYFFKLPIHNITGLRAKWKGVINRLGCTFRPDVTIMIRLIPNSTHNSEKKTRADSPGHYPLVSHPD
jgi:hypothetical protein